jgi:hypothetical protein
MGVSHSVRGELVFGEWDFVLNSDSVDNFICLYIVIFCIYIVILLYIVNYI